MLRLLPTAGASSISLHFPTHYCSGSFPTHCQLNSQAFVRFIACGTWVNRSATIKRSDWKWDYSVVYAGWSTARQLPLSAILLWFTSHVFSDRGLFVVTIVVLKAPSVIEVSHYLPESAVEDAWFLWWHEFSEHESELGPRGGLSSRIWTRLVDTPRMFHAIGGRWQCGQSEFNPVRAKEDGKWVDLGYEKSFVSEAIPLSVQFAGTKKLASDIPLCSHQAEQLGVKITSNGHNIRGMHISEIPGQVPIELVAGFRKVTKNQRIHTYDNQTMTKSFVSSCLVPKSQGRRLEASLWME